MREGQKRCNDGKTESGRREGIFIRFDEGTIDP